MIAYTSSGSARAAPSAACGTLDRRTPAAYATPSPAPVLPIDALVPPTADRPSAFDQRSESTLRPSPPSGGVLLTRPLHIEHRRRGHKRLQTVGVGLPRRHPQHRPRR